MNLKSKVFSSPSLGNIRFSYTDNNFYKKKREKNKKKKPKLTSDYKDLFKNFYKRKATNNNDKDSNYEITNCYLKCQKNVQNYFLNDENKLGLRFEGNKNLENFSLNIFNNIFNKACSAREQILQNKILDYYYPKDNNDKLMGVNMKLTPIPVKKFIFMKNDKEKEEYLKAKRSAVCMRRLEYTHGLRKNNSQENFNFYEGNNDKNYFLAILKGAVLIIEDWWIKILNKRYYFDNNNLDEDSFIPINEKESNNSIEQNLLKSLNYNSENNINRNNIIVDDWITKQAKRIIDKNEKRKNHNYKFKYSEEYNNKLKNKKKRKITNKTKPIVLNNNNNINSSDTVFKSNKRYLNSNEPKKNKNFLSKNNNQQCPIKIIQNSNIIPLDYKSNIQTVISPSNYLQNYFKDFCLNNKLYNTTSHKRDSLKSFENIQNKYKKYRNFSTSKNNIHNIIDEDEIVNQDMNLLEEKNNPPNILRGHNKNKNNINNNGNNEEIKNNLKKDLSSEIDPIYQDDMINIMNEEKNSDNIRRKSEYHIKFNIYKKNNNYINSERSSLDGSVDEIITKKLKETHEHNEKYTQRILKAYNQVKLFKSYSLDKKSFFKKKNINNFNSAPFSK